MAEAKKTETSAEPKLIEVKFNYAHTVNRTEYKKDQTGKVRPHIAERLEAKGIAKRV